MSRLQNAALRFRITSSRLRGLSFATAGLQAVRGTGSGPRCWHRAWEHPALYIPPAPLPPLSQALSSSASVSLIPSFADWSFSLVAPASPFSNEHSLECETIESHLPLTQMGKLRLRKRRGLAPRYTSQGQSLWKTGGVRPHYGCQGVDSGVAPEWFSSLSGVTSQDNAPNALLGPPHTGILPS